MISKFLTALGDMGNFTNQASHPNLSDKTNISVKENQTISLLKHFNEYQLPVDIFSLAKKMGYVVNIIEQEHRLVIYPSKSIINIKSSEPIVSQRYLTAFATGYLLNNKENFYSSDNTFNIYSLNNLYENQYAMYFLMPRDSIFYLLNHKGISRIEQLSDSLYVSQVAVLQRLRDLKVVS